MAGNILRFPHTRPVENGLTYIVPFDDTGAEWTWSLYRQAPGANEPELVDVFDDLPRALIEGREHARRNRDRFIVDEGVQA